MKHIILDTNPFLRLFLNDNPQQVAEFEKLLMDSKALKITLFVPQIVIFELNFVLDKYYKFEMIEISKRLKSIIQAPYLQVQDKTIFSNALKFYEENSISLADSFILFYAREKKGDLFTFDKKLKNLK